MALNDALTGLANRTLLGDRIRQATARADRGARPPSVLVLDLDEFKTINDGLGHGAGDEILIEVARRLTSVVRETDTVARLGGDEFAILMPDATEDDALRVAERALKELAEPDHRWRPRGLGRRQHRAVLRFTRANRRQSVARRGHGDVRSESQWPRKYSGFPSGDASRRPRTIADCLRIGHCNCEYTTGICTTNRSSSSIPAASSAPKRWSAGRIRSADCCLPAEFIAVAEDSGHIIELGHWVVQASIAQLQNWTAEFPQAISAARQSFARRGQMAGRRAIHPGRLAGAGCASRPAGLGDL